MVTGLSSELAFHFRSFELSESQIVAKLDRVQDCVDPITQDLASQEIKSPPPSTQSAHGWSPSGACVGAEAETPEGEEVVAHRSSSDGGTVRGLFSDKIASVEQEGVAPEQELAHASDDDDGSSVSGDGLTLCLQDDAVASARLEALLARLQELVPSGVDSTREEAYSRYALVYGDCDGYMDSLDAMLTKLENRPRAH